MPQPETARHHLPMLAVSQAQKEITHNEALVLVDALLHPIIEDRLSIPPVATVADIGKCWLVGTAAQDEWFDKTDQIAIWVGGSWRFLAPCEGMQVRMVGADVDWHWSQQNWVQPPQIPNPDGGATIDLEARQAIITLLQHFRTIGLVTS